MPKALPQNLPDEATLDLLIKQVTEGLSPAEQRALDVLDSEVASALQRDLERAAAAITLAAEPRPQPLPAELAQRIAETAPVPAAQSPASAAGANVVAIDAMRGASAGPGAGAAPSAAASTRPRSGGPYGWLAAAACLVVAIFGWIRSPSPVEPVAVVTPPVTTTPTPTPTPEIPAMPPTPAAERAALLADAGSLKITLGATKDPAAAGVTGDVVWDPVAQRGFLHFAGLKANDPSVHQYQLWIFDASRDKRYPVDGGVFDVPANAAEVVIPIRAALMVYKPAAFAVTIEKPGGTVVSDRNHVVALGAAT